MRVTRTSQHDAFVKLNPTEERRSRKPLHLAGFAARPTSLQQELGSPISFANAPPPHYVTSGLANPGLEKSYRECLRRLQLAADCRDGFGSGHTRRVGTLAANLAATLGFPPSCVRAVRSAAPLHDIGKLAVPDAILLKPGPLTVEEFEIMRAHTEIGARILSGSRSPLLQAAADIARFHHENWDGSGYAGVVGDDIPITARITALADVFDALTHERPYKPAWSVEDALEHVATLRGSKFDPQVVDALLQLVEAEPALLQSEWAGSR